MSARRAQSNLQRMSRRSSRRLSHAVQEALEPRRLLAVVGDGQAGISEGVLIVNGTSDADVISVTIGAGLARAVINGEAEDFTTSQFSDLLVRGLAGNDVISLVIASTDGVGANVSGGDGADTIRGGGGHDTLAGDGGNDNIWGGAGSDTLMGGEGDDLLRGNAGADQISGGAGIRDIADYTERTTGVVVTIGNAAQGDGSFNENDNVAGDVERVYGGTGNDQLSGNAAANVLRGYGGRDTLIGGDGGDALVGGSGNDLLRGGAGNEVMQGDAGSDTMRGEAGRDTADYTTRTANLTISLDNVANDGVAGEADNVESDVERIIGGTAHDKILGSNADNTIYGGRGLDTIFGYGGRDTIYGGSHSDRLDAGIGDDVVYGEHGNNVLKGGPGLDTLRGAEGNDWFYTRDTQVDHLFGGDGTNTALEADQIDVLDNVLWPTTFQEHVNIAEVKALLLGDVHRINGGLARDSGGNFVTDSSGRALPDTQSRAASDPSAGRGMGSYITGFDGFFRTAHLTRQFDASTNLWWGGGYRGTPISQSRAIYINAIASRNAASAGEAAKFRGAADVGADFLYRELNPAAGSYGFRDPVNGGYFFGVEPTQSGGQPVYGTYQKQEGTKSSYGQVHPIFALVNAYQATGEVGHLNAALASWDSFYANYRDLAYTGSFDQGAYLPDQNEDFSALTDTRNLDYMCHTFETAYVLWAALSSNHARKLEMKQRTEEIGNFIVNVMIQPMSQHNDRSYIPWRYEADWDPVVGGTMSVGHNFEYAFLLNRAVASGLGSSGWLNAADELVNFGLAYGTDWKGLNDRYFVINNSDLNYNGSDPDTAQDVGWWPQVEMARALAYYAFARGRTDLVDEFDGVWRAYREKLIDQTYGGTWQALNPTTLAGVTGDWLKEAKVWEWKVYYHETMMYDELIRLGGAAPAGLASVVSAPARTATELAFLASGSDTEAIDLETLGDEPGSLL